MAFFDPLFDAIGVKNVLFIANKRGYHFSPPEVAPANGTLLPETILRLFLKLFLFAFESRFVQTAENFRNWKRHLEYSPKHVFSQVT